jgi:hypothetical protein
MALGAHLHATWDILALAPTPSLNMPLVIAGNSHGLHSTFSLQKQQIILDNVQYKIMLQMVVFFKIGVSLALF